MAYPESAGSREYRAQGWRGGRARNRAVEVFRRKTWIALAATLAGALALGSASVAHAQSSLFGGGRLTATGGVSAVDGSAGGGINPWAMIAGYGTNRQIGGSVFYTHIALPNYGLNAYGATIGLFDRVELSYARQGFSLGNTGPQLDGAIAGTPLDRVVQPLLRVGNSGKEVGSVVALPFLVGLIERRPELYPVLKDLLLRPLVAQMVLQLEEQEASAAAKLIEAQKRGSGNVKKVDEYMAMLFEGVPPQMPQPPDAPAGD